MNTNVRMQATLLLLKLIVCIVVVVAREECDKKGILRRDPKSNEIQVCYSANGEMNWVCICNDNWNTYSLTIYCRQTGYNEVTEIATHMSNNSTGSLKFLLLSECTGEEVSLLDCNHTSILQNCSYARVNGSEDCKRFSRRDFSTKNNLLIVCLVAIPIVCTGSILTTFCAIGIAFTTYRRRKEREIARSSNDELTPQDLTIINYGIEDVTREPCTRRINNEETNSTEDVVEESPYLIPNSTEDVVEESPYLIPNSEYMGDNASLLESGEYAVLVEGEVTDYNVYAEINQLKNELFEEITLRYNNIFPDYETASRNRKERVTSSIYIEPPTSLPQLESVFNHCFNEIESRDIEIGVEFASGQFGVVYRAVYHTEKGDIPVAIKTLKEAANSDMKVAFMREAAILAQFQHPNVLRMIGVLTTQQPYMMVTELLKTGLAELLLKFKTLQTLNNTDGSVSLQKLNLPPLLLRFSQDISAGMEHLSEKHFIHRDLAARNVLVAKDLSCRIADFGMSRELNSDSEYYTSSGGRIPLRWTAPEAVFYQKYSEKSDVWSFGMTLFEIWSLGDKPWGNDATNEMIIEGLSVGRKLSPPTGCPRDVYSVMVDTWRVDPSSRPTFSHILHQLTNVRPHDTTSPSFSSTDPSQYLGNDPILSKDRFPDLQQIY